MPRCPQDGKADLHSTTMSRLDRAALDRLGRQVDKLERKPTRTSIVEGMVAGAAVLPVAPVIMPVGQNVRPAKVRIRIDENQKGEDRSEHSPVERRKGLTDGDEGGCVAGD